MIEARSRSEYTLRGLSSGAPDPDGLVVRRPFKSISCRHQVWKFSNEQPEQLLLLSLHARQTMLPVILHRPEHEALL